MIIQETLQNGIRIIGETMENVRSCSIGIWGGTGSAFEGEGEGGASHFIEHMLFKGTERRSAQDIAAEMDGIGGNINAFTSKECTCFYAKVLDEHLDRAVDVLSDIVLHSKFEPDEIKKEQGVVCEEILMVQDSPEDLAHDTIASLYYEGDPLAKPILGTEQSVRALRAKDACLYEPAVCDRGISSFRGGHFEKEKLVDLINRDCVGGRQQAGFRYQPCAGRDEGS
jgi:predicted Zn-dependent peptidase